MKGNWMWWRKRSGRGATDRRRPKWLSLEGLESRQLLAVSGNTPAIRGNSFLDTNVNGTFNPGEGVSGLTIRLFRDNGDGSLNETTDTLVATDTTDANGEYCFENLDAAAAYIVEQLPGTGVGRILSALTRPGVPDNGAFIDTFETAQSVTANSDASPVGDVEAAAESIGGERDILATWLIGDNDVDLDVSPSGSGTLQLLTGPGVAGRGAVTWDGIDGSATVRGTGLNGRDLTSDGDHTGIVVRLGAEMAGATLTLELFQGDAPQLSSTTINVPVTTGGSATQTVFIPFSSFTGTANLTDIDAIVMTIQVPLALDVEVDMVGLLGPKERNFVNPPATDLAVTKSDGVAQVPPNRQLTYTITATNNGPLAVSGATLTDDFPDTLTNINFTSSTTTGVTGQRTSGNLPDGGVLTETLNMPVGSSIVYTVVATVAAGVTVPIVNPATIAVPNGFSDTNSANNRSEDRTEPLPQTDLQITKTNDATSLVPGQAVTYRIVVTNAGPTAVTGATVTDTFPTTLTAISFSSTAQNGATGNTASGNNITALNESLNLPVGSSVTYTINATVAANATGTLTNTANVNPPNTVADTIANNNTATDADPLTPRVDVGVTKTDNSTTISNGQSLTYTIVVNNTGPSVAASIPFTDSFPSSLENISFTSTAQGGASGNTSGNGNISNVLTLLVGSSVTYTVTARVTNGATGTISNTAAVQIPQGLTDTNANNNSATDTTNIIPPVDLQITKTNNVASLVPGTAVTYTIVATNAGPSPVTGARVTDTFPATLTNITFSSVAAGGATGNTANGTIDANNRLLDQTLTMPAGGSVTYTIRATVAADATGSVNNTANIAAPNNVNETNAANNSASDSDPLTPQVDLTVTKTDNTDTVVAGATTTYTIVVTNTGPSLATGVRLNDTFPATLSNIRFTSSAAGGATGNAASGNIDLTTRLLEQTLIMPPGSSVTYAVTATVAADATGNLVNTVNVTASSTVTETNTANNTATDTDRIRFAPASIAGIVYVDLNRNGTRDSAEPGIGGVNINLTGTDVEGAQINRDVATAADGSYRFTDLQPGTYFVDETQPNGFRDGNETVGNGDGRIEEDDRFRINLASGNNATSFNFGEQRPDVSKRDLLASAFRNRPA